MNPNARRLVNGKTDASVLETVSPNVNQRIILLSVIFLPYHKRQPQLSLPDNTRVLWSTPGAPATERAGERGGDLGAARRPPAQLVHVRLDGGLGGRESDGYQSKSATRAGVDGGRAAAPTASIVGWPSDRADGEASAASPILGRQVDGESLRG